MTDTREPIQKRSIEKKQKILKAGFELFCEKGYYKTNTIEIAKCAGVSTGAVYSYFKDKRHIYIASFEEYLNTLSIRLFEKLGILQPPHLPTFIEKWIDYYVELYADASRPLVQLRMMILDDDEIKHHFSDFENTYFIKIVELLNKDGIVREDLFEKVYASCTLIDALRQEKAAFVHSGLDFEKLKQQITATILHLLSE